MKLPSQPHLHQQKAVDIREERIFPADNGDKEQLQSAEVRHAFVRNVAAKHLAVVVDQPLLAPLQHFFPRLQLQGLRGLGVPGFAHGAEQSLQDGDGGHRVLHVVIEQKLQVQRLDVLCVLHRERPHRSLLLAQTADQDVREEGQLAQQLQRAGKERGVAAVQRVVQQKLQGGGEAGEVQRQSLLEIARRDEKLLRMEELREEEVEGADRDGTQAERVDWGLAAAGEHRQQRAVAPEKSPNGAGGLRLDETMRTGGRGGEGGDGGEPGLE